MIVAVALLIGFFVFQGILWSYVSNTAENLEKEDFDQLSAIAANVQTVVVLLVGAIFGVGATQGVAAGAAKAADDNKKEAEKASDTANKNAAIAKQNLRRADTLESATKSLAKAIQDYKGGRSQDDSAFVPRVEGLTVNLTGRVQDGPMVQYDSELDRMAGDAETILRTLR